MRTLDTCHCFAGLLPPYKEVRNLPPRTLSCHLLHPHRDAPSPPNTLVEPMFLSLWNLQFPRKPGVSEGNIKALVTWKCQGMTESFLGEVWAADNKQVKIFSIFKKLLVVRLCSAHNTLQCARYSAVRTILCSAHDTAQSNSGVISTKLPINSAVTRTMSSQNLRIN